MSLYEFSKKKNILWEKILLLKSCLLQLYFFLNSHSLRSKIHLYKTLFQPIWGYGVQIFGLMAKSNLQKIQAFHSKFVRLIFIARFCISNAVLLNDLKILLSKNTLKITTQYFLINYLIRIFLSQFI